MVLHAFRVGFGSLGGNTDGKQQLDHKPMPRAHAIGEFAARLRQEDAAVGPGRRQAFPLEAGDALKCGRMRDAQALGDISRPRLAVDTGTEVGHEARTYNPFRHLRK
jgi:hypothetical protein